MEVWLEDKKKCFLYKNKRYGWENNIDTRIGSMPFFVWKYMMLLPFVLGIPLLAEIIYYLLPYTIIYTLRMIAILGAFFYLAYLFFSPLRVSCRYCATDKKEVEKHIEEMCKRNEHYINNISDIISDNEWYMLYELKKKKKIK